MRIPIGPTDRVLIIKPSSLGDVVYALPVLHAIRRHRPRAEIWWLVTPGCSAVLPARPVLDGVIHFDRRRFGRCLYDARAAAELARLLLRLRAMRFDVVLDLQGLLRSGLLSAVTNAPVRAGFANAREAGWVFYTHLVPVETMDSHIVERCWRFVELMGFADVPKRFDIPIGERQLKAVDEMLAASGYDGRPIALLAPGGREPSKRWPAERFARLAELLGDEFGFTAVVAAGADERPITQRLVAACRINVVDLTGRSSLGELVALISKSAVVVSNDSGPLHIASAMRVPVVGLYGPTDPRRVGPYGNAGAVVCAGPYESLTRRYHRRPENRIERISVEMVVRKLHEVLSTVPHEREAPDAEQRRFTR